VTQTPVPPITETPKPPDNAWEDPSLRGFPTLEGGQNAILRAGTFVGNDPFAVDDSYGPRVPPPGPIGALLRVASVIHSFFGRASYGSYLNTQEPNVIALLAYSQSDQGTLLQQVDVVNGSDQPLKVSLVVERGDGRITVIGPEWVSPGSGSLGLSGFADSDAGSIDRVLLSPTESGQVTVGIVASFNRPPLIRNIHFDVPSAAREISHGH
jgi:hypothetical protein